MATIGAHGITARLPDGFEGRIFVRPATVGVTYPVGQFATFPIPDDIGDFGSGAVTLMGPSDVFATLFEYGPESLGTALFARQGRPAGFSEADFSPMTLRRGIPGQSGTQWFFTEAGRPFSFYAVLGSHALRPALVPRVNTLLSSLTLSPAVSRPSRREAPMELIGLYLIAAGLLVVAGVAKAARPDDTARAMAALLPGSPPLRLLRGVVRVGALAEAALGAVALAFPRPATAALVAALLRSASSASWPTPAGAAGPSPPVAASAAPTRRPPRSTWSSTSCWPPPRRPSPPAPRPGARW